MNLDNRHRDKNGQVERKHGNTKMKTLKPDYPALKHFHNDTRLSDAERRAGADSLDSLLRNVTEKKRGR